MKMYERLILESLENIQDAPGEALRVRVMNNITCGENGLRFYRRKLPVRVTVVAAVLSVLILTTAFTFGHEIVGAIKHLVFGGSTASQVVYENVLQIGSVEIRNREDLSDARDYPIGIFETLEEARQAAPFKIMKPAYLPNNIIGLRNVGVWRVECLDDTVMHFVSLNYDIALENGDSGSLVLRQTYAGPNAYFVIENRSSIAKAMVGDIESLLITEKEGGNNNVIGYTLYWLQDGIAYELSAECPDGYTPETMIRIAESIHF